MKIPHTTISHSLIRGILFAAILCLLFTGIAEATETSDEVFPSSMYLHHYIGDMIEISGTSRTGNLLNFSINGATDESFEETDLTEFIRSQVTGVNWMIAFSTEDVVSPSGKKLGSGTYRVQIKEEGVTVAFVYISLTPPYLSITSIPSVVSQNSVMTVTVNEYVGDSVRYYIFGAGFFESDVVTYEESTFQINLPIDDSYDVGEYILVIQNSMIDKKFNIYPEGNRIILPPSETPRELDVFARQPSNVANALCAELDSEDIDDMYVRTTFSVVASKDTAAPSTSISLTHGWNFISVPKYLDASCDTAGELFASLDTGGMSILGYDAKTGWHTLKADTPIKPLEGYWVYSKNAKTIPLTYSADINVPPTKAVYQGWNAVGLSAEKPMTAKSAFANLNWVRCLPWDVVEGKWGTVIVKGGSAENSEELKLTLGSGNWLYVEADGTYTGNTA